MFGRFQIRDYPEPNMEDFWLVRDTSDPLKDQNDAIFKYTLRQVSRWHIGPEQKRINKTE